MRFIIKLLLLFFANMAIAETCPTVDEIKQHRYHDWHAYMLDNGEPVSAKNLLELEQNIQRFDFAVWLQFAPEGEAECYYQGAYIGKGQWGVYFAKQKLRPFLINGVWQNKASGFLQCNAPLEECLFTQ